jgi:hypothetical protein
LIAAWRTTTRSFEHMNPLTSILGTIISGFVLAIIIVVALGPTGVNPIEIAVWAHVLVGITWIGLLYYFNFVQVPAVGAALLMRAVRVRPRSTSMSHPVPCCGSAGQPSQPG